MGADRCVQSGPTPPAPPVWVRVGTLILTLVLTLTLTVADAIANGAMPKGDYVYVFDNPFGAEAKAALRAA